MAWDTDLLIMTRVLVNDLADPQKYGDEELKKVVACAAVLVAKDVELGNDYVIDVATPTISPDPVTANDTTFMALVPLKAACILNQGAYLKAIGQGIRVRDGDSQIDTSVGFQGYRDILTLGPCKSYEKLRWSIQSGTVVGDAVMGPYRGVNDNYIDSVSFFYDDFAALFAPIPRKMWH